MKLLIPILQFLIFPGFLFTAALGLLASGIDRKVTARIQYRIGPPLHQGFIDVLKLFAKETLLPSGGIRPLFIIAPLAGLTGVTLVSTIIWLSITDTSAGFIGDIIVVLYLLTLPALSMIMAGFASNNSYASLGSSREMKMVLSYELPFILALAVPIIKAGGALTIGEILNYQHANGIMVSSLSGSLSLVAAVLCMQAKLGLVPFDISEAETEIMGGPIIEYSGPPLAMFKLTKAMLLFTVPVLLVAVFMGGVGTGGWPLVNGILKYVALLVVTVLLRNTNPRLRVDQALRFFWGPVTVLAVLAVILAVLGY